MIAAESESDHGLTVPTFSPTVTLPAPVGAHDHAAQREWEHYQVAKGIERYRRSLVRENKHGKVTQRDLGDVTHGQRIASELIGPMVAAVSEYQQAFADRLNSPDCPDRLPEATTALTLLPAETIAACAVLTALANPVDAGWTSVRIACAARLRHELEYQEWKRAEAAAEKERKATGEDGINLFKLMLRRTKGDVDKRVFDKWSKKSGKLLKQHWDQRLKVFIGGEVMTLLVESNGWFKVESKFEPGQKYPKEMFGMTETALALTSHLEGQCELQRPFLAPMICEPADYVVEPQVSAALN
jgi:hypothetical protein